MLTHTVSQELISRKSDRLTHTFVTSCCVRSEGDGQRIPRFPSSDQMPAREREASSSFSPRLLTLALSGAAMARRQHRMPTQGRKQRQEGVGGEEEEGMRVEPQTSQGKRGDQERRQLDERPSRHMSCRRVFVTLIPLNAFVPRIPVSPLMPGLRLTTAPSLVKRRKPRK